MARVRFLWTNLVAAAATDLTASSEASGLPVKAAVNPDRTYAWRSAVNTVAQTIDIDLGAPMAVSAVALANLKKIGTGVVELYQRGSSDTPGTAVLVATLPTQDQDTRVAFAFFTEVTYRHWQLKWTNPTAVSDYAELGYLFLGTYLEPSVNVSVPIDVQHVDPTVAGESLDGQGSFTTRTPYAAGAFRFSDIPDDDLTNLRTVRRAMGIRVPFILVLDVARTWTAWMARFASDLDVTFGEVSGRYHVAFTWLEAR
jgi:hypothetical protein